MAFAIPFLTGLAFGLSAGVSPGPLMALVISQTLRHSAREGAIASLAPLATDGPLIAITWLLLDRLPGETVALGVVTLLGSLFIFYLGLENLRAPAPEMTSEATDAPNSFRKALAVNYLSPHPYLFWTTVGTPMLIVESQRGPLGPVGFVAGFFLGLIGTKMSLAFGLARSSRWLAGGALRALLRLMGWVMIAMAGKLLWDALGLLGASSRPLP